MVNTIDNIVEIDYTIDMSNEIKNTVYRGTGNQKKDNKNIGTYYTTDKEEALFYGSNIEEKNIKNTRLMIVTENDLDTYIDEWLENLDYEEREYQENTKAYFNNQTGEILAAQDAISRGYAGLRIKNIIGETENECDYIILF